MKASCALIAMSLVAASAVAGAGERPLAAQQILRKGNGPDVETLDPQRAEGVSSSNVLRDLYEGLVAEAQDSSPIPGAAESWTISDDQLVYTFRLRANGRWSNGDPVTADDFVAGLRRSADPATGSHYAQILTPIANADAVTEGKLPPDRLGVEAVDPLTLRVSLKGPTPYFIGLLTHSSTYPVHRASLAKYGEQFAQPGKMISNGAYRLVERVVQSHVLLERNPYYWDNAHTTLDQVKYLNTEDINSEFKRFRAGELDWTEQIPASERDRIRKDFSRELRNHTYLGIYYYGLNLARPPFKDNPKLRRALSLAIDREVITAKVVGMGQEPADSWVPPGIIGHRTAKAEWAGLTREQSLTEARRLYAEAGYSAAHPAEVEIRYNTNDDHKRIATAIAAMWKQWLGVKTTLTNEEWKVFLQDRKLKSRTQAFRAGWIGDYNDANTFLEIMQSTHGLNDTGYASSRYDALLAKAGVEADPERRREFLYQAERQLMEDLPAIPIYFYVTSHLVTPRLVGWQGNIMDHHPSRFMKLLAQNPPPAPPVAATHAH